MASKPHTARERDPAEEPEQMCSCSRPKPRRETGMQKIQHPNSLQIGIHPLWTADESQGWRRRCELCTSSLAVMAMYT